MGRHEPLAWTTFERVRGTRVASNLVIFGQKGQNEGKRHKSGGNIRYKVPEGKVVGER